MTTSSTRLTTLICDALGGPFDLMAQLQVLWRKGGWAALVTGSLLPEWQAARRTTTQIAAHTPGVVVGSGGSSGRRRWCLQPLRNLERSAMATARWLGELGLDPQVACHLNPLPLHHLSGLMPWVRAQCWGGSCQAISPALLRDSAALLEALPVGSLFKNRPVVISLVPTQLQRLLADPECVRWLRGMAVIWVGGAALLPGQAERARQERLPLSPCYGATETAAMVCAQPPERFLAGDPGCGPALGDASLRIAADGGAIEVACSRLSPGWMQNGIVHPLPTREGWWRSGDAGEIGPAGLIVTGRLDGAISSGGETVFPERVETKLHQLAAAAGLPLSQLLLIPVPDPLWSTRLVALVRPPTEPFRMQSAGDGKADPGGGHHRSLLSALGRLAEQLPPAERPLHWCLCPDLAPSESGKWERARWQSWWQAHRSEAEACATEG